MGLSEVEICRTQKHGKICFFNQTGSLYFILANFQRKNSFAFQKKEEKARNGRLSRFQTSVPSSANFLCTFVCIALPNTVIKLNQIWIYDVTGVSVSRFSLVQCFYCLLNEDWDHLGLWHMLNYFTEVRFQISSYMNIRTCLLVWNCLCALNFATAVL